MTEPFQYTGSGLDWVFLENGYEIRTTPYGEGVAIRNADDLHKAIARAIIISGSPMRGQEVRFLRSLLNLSQSGIGHVLGQSRTTIARWEGDRNETIPAPSDRLLKLFYALKNDGHDLANKLVDLLTELDELNHEMKTTFAAQGDHWKIAA